MALFPLLTWTCLLNRAMLAVGWKACRYHLIQTSLTCRGERALVPLLPSLWDKWCPWSLQSTSSWSTSKEGKQDCGSPRKELRLVRHEGAEGMGGTWQRGVGLSWKTSVGKHSYCGRTREWAEHRRRGKGVTEEQQWDCKAAKCEFWGFSGKIFF